ncbi:protein FLC EXPRESSOR-like isoform X1 [Olea europaea var. sylvestris]|uniref:protein FLC EXPRESSOR-like isoform X1 n=1 Tax=Olea europaea var. sylvestris TaxID=158386 RepID=UPI000C1D42EE|nr:protein FLC EXPRESSOR-like isoform X1 [Olea europaea var. sylvestris]
MAGRNYIAPRGLNLRPSQHSSLHRLPPPDTPVHLLEERVIAQSRDIELLLSDNQRLANAHVALKQDLAAAEQDIHRLTATAASVKAERDAQVREVYERSLKLEAEARSVNGLVAEVDQVRANIEELRAERKELAQKLKDVDVDLAKTQLELQQMAAVKAEIEVMLKEIQRGRSAIEYERKMHSNNLELSEAMEKHMKSMAQEIDKLRPELANAEKKAMAAAAAAQAQAQGYPNLETGYGGNFGPGPYVTHQVQGGVAPAFQYAPPPLPVVPNGPPAAYDMQQQLQMQQQHQVYR